MSFLKQTVNDIKWSPLVYTEAAVIAHEAADEMLARLDWMMLAPKVIVELGCGMGDESVRLQKRYPEAVVVAVDLSSAFLEQAHVKVPHCIEADAALLPFANQQVDFIFANLLLPWHQDMFALLQECRRVLRPEGLFMLSALGLDTLREYEELTGGDVLPTRVDMHTLGDMLVKAGFAEPVLDVDDYTTVYRDKEKLMAELEATGMIVSSALVKEKVEKSTEEKYALTYEIIYAHAFVPTLTASDSSSISETGEARFFLSQLRRAR